MFLPPTTKLGQGNILNSVHGGGEYLGRYTSPGQVHPQAGTPPRQVHPPAGTPPGKYTPQVYPLAGTPPGRYTLWAVHPQAGIPRQVHPPGQVPPGQVPPRAGTHPSAQCLLGDTGNKRAVRILLECNLVIYLRCTFLLNS